MQIKKKNLNQYDIQNKNKTSISSSILTLDFGESYNILNNEDYNKFIKVKQYIEELRIQFFLKNDNFKKKYQKKFQNFILNKNSLENEDAMSIMNLITGGYVLNDYDTYLSLQIFNETKDNFLALENIYNYVDKLYQGRKLQFKSFKQRSILSLVYLNRKFHKMSRIEIKEFLAKNTMVD